MVSLTSTQLKGVYKCLNCSTQHINCTQFIVGINGMDCKEHIYMGFKQHVIKTHMLINCLSCI